MDIAVDTAETDVALEGRGAVLRRRRQVLIGLVAVVGASLPLAVNIGGTGWIAFGLPFTLLVAYVVMLRSWKVTADRAAEVLRELPLSPDGDHPEPGGAAAGYKRLDEEIAAGAEPARFGVPPFAAEQTDPADPIAP